MEYGDYKWKFNPKKIEINEERNIKEQIIPFFGNVFQDYGRKKRIVKGYGEFFGDDAIERGDTLWSIANLYSISIDKLLKENPQIKRPDELVIGQKVILP